MRTPRQAAAELAAARAERRTLERFSGTDADPDPGDAGWGLAVQDLDRAARLAAGERLVGAKLGLTSAAKQRTMGVPEPIVGFLTDAMATYDVAGLAQPRVEPEVAFRLGRDLAGAVSRAEAVAHVDGVALALEVLDSRWTGYRFGLADVLADNTSAAGFELGRWHDPRTVPDLAAVRCSWVVDGVERAVVTPGAILGDPWLALVHLAEHLAARGEVLPAGSVVLAGAMTDAVPLPAAVRVEADGLGAVALG